MSSQKSPLFALGGQINPVAGQTPLRINSLTAPLGWLLVGCMAVLFDTRSCDAQVASPATASQTKASVTSSNDLQIMADITGRNGTDPQVRKITKLDLDAATFEAFGVELPRLPEARLHFLRRRVLDRLVDEEVLKLAADEFSQSSSKSEIASAGSDRKVPNYLEQKVFADVSVSEADAEAYYKTHTEEFLIPMEVELREIVRLSKSGETELELSEKASLLQRLAQNLEKSPHKFGEIARLHSQARSAARGGLRGFVTTSQLEPEVAAQVEELGVGEISQVISTRSGLHLIRIEQRRGNILPSFAEVKKRITKGLLVQRRNAALSSHLTTLRRDYRVIIYYR